MGIINSPPAPVSPPTHIERAVSQIRGAANNTLSQLIATYNRGFGLVWNNPAKLTPQQVLTGFGTDAGDLVTRSAQLGEFINSQKPGAVVVAAPKALTINADGTVTVAP